MNNFRLKKISIMLTLLVLCLILVVKELFFVHHFKRRNEKRKIHKNPVIDIDITDNNTERKYVYIDLGANNGDSLANFFGLDNEMPIQLSNKLIQSLKWDVYAFEANPLFDQNLFEMKNTLLNRNHTVYLFHSTAAWIKNGHVDFYLDLVNKEHNFWGSSLKTKGASVRESASKNVQNSC